MSLLPEIIDGKIVEQESSGPFIPPSERLRISDEARLSELNNFGHEEVTEDFSDSPFADRV